MKQLSTEHLRALVNERLRPELERRGVTVGPWKSQTKRHIIGSTTTYWFSFWLGEREHVVDVDEGLTMGTNGGRALYECEEGEEFANEAWHFRCFMDRLGNFLDHGKWAPTAPLKGRG